MANEEKENNEAAPVLNADEASNENAGGETLANSVGSEVVEASVETSVDNNEEAEPAEFDPQAFAGVGEPAATDENSEVEAENTEEKTTENAGTDNDGGDSDDGDDFVWPDLPTNSSEEENKEVLAKGPARPRQDEGQHGVFRCDPGRRASDATRDRGCGTPTPRTEGAF